MNVSHAMDIGNTNRILYCFVLGMVSINLSFGCTTTTAEERMAQRSRDSKSASLAGQSTQGMRMDLAESYDDKQSVYRASEYRIIDIPDVGAFYLPSHLVKRIRLNWTVAKAKLKNSPNDTGALRTLATYELLMGNSAGAQTYIGIARGAGGAKDCDSSLVMALAHLAQSDTKRANSEFSACENSAAGFGISQINLGLYSLSLGNAKQAVVHFSMAASRDSKNAVAQIHLGQAYYLTRQFERSVESFDKALQIDPGNALALYNKGVVLHRGLRSYGKARDSLEEVVSSAQASINLKKKATGAINNLDRDQQGKENLATIGVF